MEVERREVRKEGRREAARLRATNQSLGPGRSK